MSRSSTPTVMVRTFQGPCGRSIWFPLDGPLTKESRGNRRIRQRHEEALRRVIASPEDGQVIGRPMADRRFASRPDQPEDDS